MDFLYICCYICAYISCYIYPYIYTCCLFILYIPFPVLSCSSLLTDYCQPKEIRGGGFLWRNLFGILYIHTNNHAFFVCLFFHICSQYLSYSALCLFKRLLSTNKRKRGSRFLRRHIAISIYLLIYVL